MAICKVGLEYGVFYIIFQNCIKGYFSYQKGTENIQKIVPNQKKVLIE